MGGTHHPGTDVLLDPATYGPDMHGVLGRLRSEAPLAWNGTRGFWALSRHADVSEVSSDPSRFCSGRGILLDEIGVTYEHPPTIMHTDPPEHTRYRMLVRPGFSNVAVRALEPLVRERADRLLDALATAATEPGRTSAASGGDDTPLRPATTTSAAGDGDDVPAGAPPGRGLRHPPLAGAPGDGDGTPASAATPTRVASGGDGTVVDVTQHLAVPLPIQVIAGMLGLPEGDEERLHRWSEAVVPGATDWPEDERNALLAEMTTELLDLAAARRREPLDDVVSMLATAHGDAGEQLSDAELGMFLIQLLVAGNETTRNAMSGGLVALAEHPEQLDRLAADPSLLPTAVEEVLRWTTPVISFLRTAVRDTTLAGTAIEAGDPLLLVYAAANRDEAEFGPTADTLDVGRTPNHHVAFGHGPHFCLGAALARLELSVVLEGVVARWARLEVAGEVVHTGSSVIAGIRSAPLRLEPRP